MRTRPPREGARARRPGLDPCAWARLRAPRRQHVLRGAGPRRRAAEPRAGRGHRHARPGWSAGGGAVPRGVAPRPPALGPHPGAPVLAAPSTTTGPRCGSACPIRTTATRPSTCSVGPCRRPTSRSDRRGCGARGRSRASRPASTTLGGFEVLALEIPHKGGRTFGYRITDGRSSIAYLSDHGPVGPRPGPRRLGSVPRGGAGAGRRRRPADPRRPAHGRGAAVPGGVRATRRPTTRCGSASWPAPRRSCCSTTTPAAPTPSSTPSSRPSRRARPCHRRRRGHHLRSGV